MKNIEKINRTFEGITDETKRLQMETFTLFQATERNRLKTESNLKKLCFGKDENGETFERELTVEEKRIADGYKKFIEGCEKLNAKRKKDLKDFEPTSRDRQIADIVACANTDNEKDFTVNFGNYFYKDGKTKKDRLIHFSVVANNLEIYRDCERRLSASKKQEDIEELKDAFNAYLHALKVFVKFNYDINSKGGTLMTSAVFEDTKPFKVSEKFARHVASFACFESSRVKGKEVQKFTKNIFFRSLCSSWYYPLLTKGDKGGKSYTAPAIMKITNDGEIIDTPTPASAKTTPARARTKATTSTPAPLSTDTAQTLE